MSSSRSQQDRNMDKLDKWGKAFVLVTTFIGAVVFLFLLWRFFR